MFANGHTVPPQLVVAPAGMPTHPAAGSVPNGIAPGRSNMQGVGVAPGAVPAMPAPMQPPPVVVPEPDGGAFWQGGRPAPQYLAGRQPAPPLLASQLLKMEAPQYDSDDDSRIEPDPDELAFARGDPEEDSVDWFDV